MNQSYQLNFQLFLLLHLVCFLFEKAPGLDMISSFLYWFHHCWLFFLKIHFRDKLFSSTEMFSKSVSVITIFSQSQVFSDLFQISQNTGLHDIDFDQSICPEINTTHSKILIKHGFLVQHWKDAEQASLIWNTLFKEPHAPA